jgi:hypothetical protein
VGAAAPANQRSETTRHPLQPSLLRFTLLPSFSNLRPLPRGTAQNLLQAGALQRWPFGVCSTVTGGGAARPIVERGSTRAGLGFLTTSAKFCI